MTLLSANGRVMSSSSLDPTTVIPTLPNQAILQQLRHGLEYAALEPVHDRGLHYRIVIPIANPDPLGEPRMLHAKAILVDDWLAILGSANMDMRSILLNYEIALCLYDSDAIRKLETWIKELTADCSIRQQRQGSSLGLIEGVGRLFAPLL
jgi:phosphatidylserine/phosphatidylglycerophosphate/cardiolipin synthase-like enzyme